MLASVTSHGAGRNLMLGATWRGRQQNSAEACIALLRGWTGLTLHLRASVPNPGDWPSRGGPSTWPQASHKSTRRSKRESVCPACGQPPRNHPLDKPRALRGLGFCCKDLGIRRAYDHTHDQWLWDADLWVERLRRAPGTSKKLLRLLEDAEAESSQC